MSRSPGIASMLVGVLALMLSSGCTPHASDGLIDRPATATVTTMPVIAAPTTSPDPTVGEMSLPSPTNAVADPNQLPPGGTTEPGGLPVCGIPAPPLPPDDPTVPPPTDECQFTFTSPSCPMLPTVIASGGTTLPADMVAEPTNLDTGGFGRWGGREGAAMCFAEFTDGSTMLSNGAEVVFVERDDRPVIFVSRTDLARSGGVWGVVSADVAGVRVVDSARPDGVDIPVRRISGGVDGDELGSVADLRVFIAPVSSGPVTVTAFSAAGEQLAAVDFP